MRLRTRPPLLTYLLQFAGIHMKTTPWAPPMYPS